MRRRGRGRRGFRLPLARIRDKLLTELGFRVLGFSLGLVWVTFGAGVLDTLSTEQGVLAETLKRQCSSLKSECSKVSAQK